jgi:hypothetical protein
MFVRFFRLFGACLLLNWSQGAAAAVPRLVPDRDVVVQYQVSPEGQAPIDVTVSIAAGGRKLRVISPDLPTTIVVRRDTETASIMLPLLRMYAELPVGRYDPERTVLRGAGYTSVGEARVAGLACTQWRAVSAEGEARACITGQGVILRGEARSVRRGALGAVVARRVAFGALPASDFEVPGNYTKSPIAIDAQGLGQ